MILLLFICMKSLHFKGSQKTILKINKQLLINEPQPCGIVCDIGPPLNMNLLFIPLNTSS